MPRCLGIFRIRPIEVVKVPIILARLNLYRMEKRSRTPVDISMISDAFSSPRKSEPHHRSRSKSKIPVVPPLPITKSPQVTPLMDRHSPIFSPHSPSISRTLPSPPPPRSTYSPSLPKGSLTTHPSPSRTRKSPLVDGRASPTPHHSSPHLVPLSPLPSPRLMSPASSRAPSPALSPRFAISPSPRLATSSSPRKTPQSSHITFPSSPIRCPPLPTTPTRTLSTTHNLSPPSPISQRFDAFVARLNSQRISSPQPPTPVATRNRTKSVPAELGTPTRNRTQSSSPFTLAPNGSMTEIKPPRPPRSIHRPPSFQIDPLEVPPVPFLSPVHTPTSLVSPLHAQAHEDWLRDRRLSSLFSGLGLGLAVTADELANDNEEEEVEEEKFESADEGEEMIWDLERPKLISTSTGINQSRALEKGEKRKMAITYGELTTLAPQEPVAVAFGYAVDEDGAELGQVNSGIRQMVIASSERKDEDDEDSENQFSFAESATAELLESYVPSEEEFESEDFQVPPPTPATPVDLDPVRSWLPTLPPPAAIPPPTSPARASTPTRSRPPMDEDMTPTRKCRNSNKSLNCKASVSPRRLAGKFFDELDGDLKGVTSTSTDALPLKDSRNRPSRRRAMTDSMLLLPCPSAPSLQPVPLIGCSPVLPRTWRSTRSEETFTMLLDRYGPLEMKRQEVIWELCETEDALVSGLRGVVKVFLQPLRTPAGTWITGVPIAVARLFDWLEDIVHLHSQISSALREIRRNQSSITFKIADTFVKFIPRLEIHQPYLVRFEAVTGMIEKMVLDNSSDFGEFVRMQQTLPECGSMSLSSFLLKPVQRLMKYPLFFKQLIDLTPATHPDHLATLSLLHSTDSIIRLMEEVKAREDEYEQLKTLAGRIKGLAPSFRLARRDRRLLAHGALHRVHISSKDRAALDMEAVNSLQRTASSTKLKPLSPFMKPFAVHPTRSFDSAVSLETRPVSFASDSSNAPSLLSDVASSIFSASDMIRTPPSPYHGFIDPNLPPSRPESFTSELSTALLTASPNSFAATSPLLPTPTGRQRTPPGRLLKTRARESTVHAFVFSDLVIFANRQSDALRLIRPNKSSSRKGTVKDTYRILEGFGCAKVLGVSDLSGRTEHDHLLEVDLLPITDADQSNLMGHFISTSSASSVYLTLASAKYENIEKERRNWFNAFETSALTSLKSLTSISNPIPTTSSRNSLLPPENPDRLSCSSFIAAGLPLPKSPSEQALVQFSSDTDTSDIVEEREERGWWAMRLKRVRNESNTLVTEPLPSSKLKGTIAKPDYGLQLATERLVNKSLNYRPLR